MNYPTPRGGIVAEGDRGFISEIRKQKIRNQKEVRKYFFNQYLLLISDFLITSFCQKPPENPSDFLSPLGEGVIHNDF